MGQLVELSTWEQAATTADGLLKASSDAQLQLQGRQGAQQERLKTLETQVGDTGVRVSTSSSWHCLHPVSICLLLCLQHVHSEESGRPGSKVGRWQESYSRIQCMCSRQVLAAVFHLGSSLC